MTLVLDRRADYEGQPGLHVLLVGVSYYHHLPGGMGKPADDSYGLGQLSAPALSAYRLWRWLEAHQNTLALPLVTCHLLLSPSEEEKQQIEQRILSQAAPADCSHLLDAAVAWRKDGTRHPGGMTWFYFGGHGLMRNNRDALLLPQDFTVTGDVLRRAVELHNLYHGMKPGPQFPAMSRRQLYLIDSCRNMPRELRNWESQRGEQVFGVPLGGADDRSAPIFFATVPGTKAYAVPGQGTLFVEALLRCLDGAAGRLPQDRWQVDFISLGEVLLRWFARLSGVANAPQEIVQGGQIKAQDDEFGGPVIRYFDSPPAVAVVLEVEPGDAHPATQVELEDLATQAVQQLGPPLSPHPYSHTLQAGIYRVSGTVGDRLPCPPFCAFGPRPVWLEPPHHALRVRVRPKEGP
jgi:hypothetical protein